MEALAEMKEAGETDAEDQRRPPEATLADTSAMAVNAWDRAGTPMDPAYRAEHAAHITRSVWRPRAHGRLSKPARAGC